MLFFIKIFYINTCAWWVYENDEQRGQTHSILHNIFRNEKEWFTNEVHGNNQRKNC